MLIFIGGTNETGQLITQFYWATCFIITMNMGSVVYFDTLTRCCEDTDAVYDHHIDLS